jgi:hypothetical protein
VSNKQEVIEMNDRIQRLRDAVVTRGREVEVTPSGEVREARPEGEAKPEPQAKATKLAPRTFGFTD